MNKKGTIAIDYILVTILIVLATVSVLILVSGKYKNINEGLANEYSKPGETISSTNEAQTIIKQSSETTSELEKLNGGSEYVSKTHTSNYAFDENKPVYIVNGKQMSHVRGGKGSIYVAYKNERQVARNYGLSCSVTRIKKNEDGSITSTSLNIETCMVGWGENAEITILTYDFLKEVFGDGSYVMPELEYLNEKNTVYNITIAGQFSVVDIDENYESGKTETQYEDIIFED